MTTTIRPAAAADLPAIAAIYADAVLHGAASYELTPPDLAEMRSRFEALAAAGYPALAAEREGRVAGYAYAGPFRTRPAYRFTAEDSVYVAPEAKGQGIGRLLLSQLVRECTALGLRQLVAVIGDGHAASASVILHEKLGFRHAGRIEGSGFKHGRWLDTALMQLSLNGGSGSPPDPDSLPERIFQSGRS